MSRLRDWATSFDANAPMTSANAGVGTRTPVARAESRGLDATRVGAFGFSNVGFTVLVLVLVAAGGVPDLSEIGPYCRAHSDHDRCQDPTHTGIDPHLSADVPAGA
jgi:hypothetical protein